MTKQTAIFSDEYKVPRGTINFTQKVNYTISRSLDDNQGSVVEIVKEFENVKESLREISDKVGFSYDVKWNTQEFGRQLVNQFGQDKEATITGYSIVITDNKSVKTSQTFKGDETKNELTKISQKAGFEIDENAEIWGLAGGLIDFLNQKK